jgi:endo-1,4-beta-D-glucanase Y
VTLTALVLAFSLTSAETAAPRRPFPQRLTYAAETIRPNHRTQARQDDDVRSYYEHWKRNYLIDEGPLGYRVSFGATSPSRTVSEGQGYGMIIVAVMAGHDPDARKYFDGLWGFARSYPSNCDSRLMQWQVPGPAGGDASAFDGDADMAFGLLLADAQWGSKGETDYKKDALTLIGAILESTIGPRSRLPMLGDWVSPGGSARNEYTPRSSDFMPGHFRAFAKATGNGVWIDVVKATQSVIAGLQANYSPQTGLLPDFIVDAGTAPKPAPPNFLERALDGDYYYNAGRDPWRLGTDAVLSGDPVSLAQTRKITRWIRTAAAGNPHNIRSGYRLNGSALPGAGEYFTIFFAAPFGVAAMTDPSQQEWLNDIYDAVHAAHEDYYEDSVTLLALLTMTGNMWSPDLQPRRRAVRR